MENSDNITDEKLRELLNKRLLQDPEESLTQQLTDMEAKLVFNDEALIVPSLQQENNMLDLLGKNRRGSLKWIFGGAGLLITSVILFIFWNQQEEIRTILPAAPEGSRVEEPFGNDPLPMTITDSIAHAKVVIPQKVLDPERTAEVDTAESTSMEKWRLGDALKVPVYKPEPEEVPELIEWDDLPLPGSKEIDENNRQKNKMVRSLLKKDKKEWAFIPMSTEVIEGETVSTQAFYMYTGEITNKQYRTFLKDLLIQGKTDEYRKALPDTNRWITETKAEFLDMEHGRKWAGKYGDLADTVKWKDKGFPFYEPMRKNYFWHPAYDNYPVVTISRDAAKMFCDWLTIAVNERIKSDEGAAKAQSLYINDVRIPSRSEWIVAARGGKGDVDYPWSGTEAKGVQNKKGCYLANFCIANYKPELKCQNNKFPNAYTSAGTVSQDYFSIAPTFSYNPNAYGLYNLCGNAAEMVWDDKTKQAATKGGSWNSDADHIKLNGSDEYGGITHGSPFIGLRPVFTAGKK